MTSWLTVALESATDGKLHKEVEHTFYGHLDHPEELKKAERVLHQEQWTVKIPKEEGSAGSGSVRVRKEHGYGESPKYIMTTKVKTKDGHNVEHEIPTTAEHLDLMKVLSSNGMVKSRYIFPIEGTNLKWEVDVFVNEEEMAAPIVKLDLEVPAGEILEELPPFPVTLSDVVTGEQCKIDPSADEKVRGWYDQHFLRKNVHHTHSEKQLKEMNQLQKDIDKEASMPNHVFTPV